VIVLSALKFRSQGCEERHCSKAAKTANAVPPRDWHTGKLGNKDA